VESSSRRGDRSFGILVCRGIEEEEEYKRRGLMWDGRAMGSYYVETYLSLFVTAIERGKEGKKGRKNRDSHR
jgi:hypothetical protein